MAVRSRRRTSARGRTETLIRRHIRCQRATTALHENISSKDLVFHSYQRWLWARVRTELSMTGGANFGLLQPELQSKLTTRVYTSAKIGSIHRLAQLSSGGMRLVFFLGVTQL